MATSIKDIANKLNMSVSTVSYALNGGPRSVSLETKNQVLAAARDLGYRPNRVARSMVTGRSYTIGVAPPEIGDDVFLSPYLQLAINGVANEAGRLHQDMLVFTRYRETEHEEMLSIILDGRVDGVIFIAPHFTAKTVELAAALQLPCVAISGAPVEGVTSFSINNEQGMTQVLEHLYELGHRRIGHIAGRLDMQDALIRLQGYQAFLHARKIPYRDEFVAKGQFLIEGGRRAMHELMNLPIRPTAVSCANDEMAIGAILATYDLGIKVPEEVSVAGFDSTPSSAHIHPPLTTVRQPIGELGEVALRTLVDMIEGNEPQEKKVFETDLIVRASTNHPMEEIHEGSLYSH
ncbi:MAG TPA: LacI family DNA-binding transcriptional regulator [Fimbriimonadaceae bacterium]|jgi:DNA-binding LacI/PurR family transcriptional regulator